MKLTSTNFVVPFVGMQFKHKHLSNCTFTVLSVQEDCGLYWIVASSDKGDDKREFCWSLLMRFDIVTEIHVYYVP